MTSSPLTSSNNATVTAQNVQLLQNLLATEKAEQQQQQKSLYSLLRQEQLTSVGVVQSENNLRTIQRVDKIRFILLIIAVAGLLLLIVSTYVTIYIRYKWMIDKIDEAIADGAFPDHGSGWFVAFAYEYPVFAALRYNNNAFPAAVVYAYYSSQFSSYMMANQNIYLEQMFEAATNGLPNVSGKPTARQIVCQVVGVPNNISQCERLCPGPNSLGALDYTTSAASWGMQGAFLGELIPVAGPVFGFLGGSILGAGLTFWKSINAQQQCSAEVSATHCLPGVSSACSA